MKIKNPLKSNKTATNSYKPLALAVAMAFSGTVTSVAQAATYIVSNTNDAGFGSLRQAVDDANNVTPGVADTIEFSILAGSIINLASELSITDSVTIEGPTAGDAGSIILDGGGASSGNRHINAGGFPSNSGQTITLENITLQSGFFDGTGLPNGSGGGGSVFLKNASIVINHSVLKNNGTLGTFAKGGGLYVIHGDTILSQSTVSNNSTSGNAARGGGFYVFHGSVTLAQSTVSGNNTLGSQAIGGGFSVFTGDATLTQSTVSGNSTSGSHADGGGGFVINGDATLTQSTVSGNSTSGDYASGGGLFVYGGNTTLVQSTVSGNSTSGSFSYGGGLRVRYGSATLMQSTLSNNSAVVGAGGLSIYMSTASRNATLINTILAENMGPEGNFHDEATTPVGLLKATNSIFGDPAIEVTDLTSSGNSLNPPNLGPLQFNGGITQTHKPNINSPAINAGSNTEAEVFSNDQRGASFTRIIDTNVDIGAIELQNVSGNMATPLNIGEVMTRRDMARVIVKANNPTGYTPPPATGLVYDDVKIGDINANWIEQLAAEGLTEGCTANRFCPNSVVMREEMAKIAFKGITSSPPNPSNVNFIDVGGPTGFNSLWINAAYEFGGITQGCIADKFCPKEPVTRKWVDGDLLGEF